MWNKEIICPCNFCVYNYVLGLKLSKTYRLPEVSYADNDTLLG